MSKTEEITEEPLIDGSDWPDAAAEVPVAKRARRLTPLTGGLLALAIAAAGFVGGVLVEKGQTGSSSTGGLPTGLTAGGGGPAGLLSAQGGSGTTFGTVANVSGRTLYVTDAQGNTVKVLTTKGSTVTRSADSKVGDIHPGDTVVIQGQTRKSGTVKAQSIRASQAGSGGAGALGAGPQVAAPGGSTESSGGAGAVDQLFGK